MNRRCHRLVLCSIQYIPDIPANDKLPSREEPHLQGKNKELWLELCEKAANEQDPEKLMDLVKQINDLLEAKERRLRGTTQNNPSAQS